jgi:hypothetical protein
MIPRLNSAMNLLLSFWLVDGLDTIHTGAKILWDRDSTCTSIQVLRESLIDLKHLNREIEAKFSVEFCFQGYTAVYFAENQPIFSTNMSLPHWSIWQVLRGTSDIWILDPTVTWTKYIQFIPTIPKGRRIIGQDPYSTTNHHTTHPTHTSAPLVGNLVGIHHAATTRTSVVTELTIIQLPPFRPNSQSGRLHSYKSSSHGTTIPSDQHMPKIGPWSIRNGV